MGCSNLKKEMTQTSVLRLLDLKKRFIVYRDDPKHAFGAVLVQKDNVDRAHPTNVASQTF